MYEVFFIVGLEGGKCISILNGLTGYITEFFAQILQHLLRQVVYRNAYGTGSSTGSTTDTTTYKVHHSVDLPLHVGQGARPRADPLGAVDFGYATGAIAHRTGCTTGITFDTT